MVNYKWSSTCGLAVWSTSAAGRVRWRGLRSTAISCYENNEKSSRRESQSVEKKSFVSGFAKEKNKAQMRAREKVVKGMSSGVQKKDVEQKIKRGLNGGVRGY